MRQLWRDRSSTPGWLRDETRSSSGTDRAYRSQPDQAAGLQVRLADPVLVEEGAVGTSQVLQQEGPLHLVDLEVMLRDGIIREDHVIVLEQAEAEARRAHRDGAPAVGPFQDDQHSLGEAQPLRRGLRGGQPAGLQVLVVAHRSLVERITGMVPVPGRGQRGTVLTGPGSPSGFLVPAVAILLL